MKSQIIFRNKKLIGFLFILPQIIIITLFFLYPSIEALRSAFLMRDAFGINTQFVGFRNFINLINDASYKDALLFSYKYAFWTLLGSTVPAIFLALALYFIKVGKAVLQSLIIWPLVVAPIIAGLLWFFLLDTSIGVLTLLIERFLIKDWNPNINSTHAFILLTIVSIWNRLGYNVIFILAALHGIPHSLYEAASLDKFSSSQTFFNITLPYISPTLFFLFVMNTVYVFFETFGITDITTKGGPGSSTVSLVYKLYNDSFSNYGSAAAQSIFLILMVSFLVFLQFKFTKKH